MANLLTTARTQEQILFTYQGTGTGTPLAFVTAPTTNPTTQWTIGTSADQVNKGHRVTTTIAAAGTLTVDLTSFTDLLGTAAAWTKLRYCRLEHSSASVASTIAITGSGSNAVSGLRTSNLTPGGKDVYDDGTGFTLSGSSKNVIVTNNDGAQIATIDLILMGTQ